MREWESGRVGSGRVGKGWGTESISNFPIHGATRINKEAHGEDNVVFTFKNHLDSIKYC